MPSPWQKSKARELVWPQSTASASIGYHLFHAVRADLLCRLGRTDEAVVAYGSAIGLTENAAERAFLTRARAAAAGSPEQ